MSKYDQLKQILEKNNGYIKTADANDNDISRTYFSQFVRENNLFRVARGLYVSEDIWLDDLFVLQMRYPNLVFSHETAAFLHSLADREPFSVSVTLATGTSSSRLNKDGLQVYKIKEELFDVGLMTVDTPLGNKVRTYDLERTFCDFIRSKNSIEIQEFQSYIQNYFNTQDRNIPRLLRYAKWFSIEKQFVIIRRCFYDKNFNPAKSFSEESSKR